MPRLRWRRQTVTQVLWVLFLLLVMTQVSLAFLAISPTAQAMLVLARRAIWLVTLVTAVLDVLRSEPSDLLGPLTVFVPFFVVGLASTLISVEPLAGLVELSLWLITVLAACVIGKRFRGRDLPTAMAGWFILVLGASVLLALVRPKLAVDIDHRSLGGDWRGVFPGKSWPGIRTLACCWRYSRGRFACRCAWCWGWCRWSASMPRIRAGGSPRWRRCSA
jgi:hypothetical protein